MAHLIKGKRRGGGIVVFFCVVDEIGIEEKLIFLLVIFTLFVELENALYHSIFEILNKYSQNSITDVLSSSHCGMR